MIDVRSIYPGWFSLAEDNLAGLMVWSLGAEGLDLTVRLLVFCSS